MPSHQQHLCRIARELRDQIYEEIRDISDTKTQLDFLHASRMLREEAMPILEPRLDDAIKRKLSDAQDAISLRCLAGAMKASAITDTTITQAEKPGHDLIDAVKDYSIWAGCKYRGSLETIRTYLGIKSRIDFMDKQTASALLRQFTSAYEAVVPTIDDPKSGAFGKWTAILTTGHFVAFEMDKTIDWQALGGSKISTIGHIIQNVLPEAVVDELYAFTDIIKEGTPSLKRKAIRSWENKARKDATLPLMCGDPVCEHYALCAFHILLANGVGGLMDQGDGEDALVEDIANWMTIQSFHQIATILRGAQPAASQETLFHDVVDARKRFQSRRQNGGGDSGYY